jgi:membrane-associated phospholipid phosphatase
MALRESGLLQDVAEKRLAADRPHHEAGVDSDARCNPIDSIGSSTKSRVSHSEPPPSARFPRDKDGSARRNIEPLQCAGGCTSRRNSGGAIWAAGLRSPLMLIAGAATTCALLTGLSMALIDRPVATWVHEHLGDQRFGWVTGNYDGHLLRLGPFSLMASPAQGLGPLAAFAFVVLAIAALAGWRRGTRGRIALALCWSAFAANEVNGSLKGLFGRTWPESWLGDNPSWIRDGVFGFFPFHGGLAWTSFPSGHTTTITATATILWVVCPELKVAWAALVAVVVTGLIAGNYHFVSDVIAGLYLGAGIGLGVAALMLSPNDRIALSDWSGRVPGRRIDPRVDRSPS